MPPIHNSLAWVVASVVPVAAELPLPALLAVWSMGLAANMPMYSVTIAEAMSDEARLIVTVVLALFTFFITQYAAIKSMGIGGYMAHMTGGVPKSLWWLWPIMIPVEFLGLFTKPFALTIRLFANMVAGHFVILALLGLIFAVSVWVAPVSVALALGIFLLELFVAFVQAYIFTMLSALFIGAGLVHHGDHDDDHGHAEHGEADHASHAAGKAPGHG